MLTCREGSGQGRERSVWAGLLVRGIQREREKREKGRLCLKTIKLGPKFETKLMFERKVRREKLSG
jgi:hypothetical protein